MRDEPDAEVYADLIESADQVAVSTATLLETAIVAGPDRHVDLDELLEAGAIEVRSFDAEQLMVARRAHRAFGRGSGSPAPLNLGDCFSYALARTSGRPLLFKGTDFTHTDIASART